MLTRKMTWSKVAKAMPPKVPQVPPRRRRRTRRRRRSPQRAQTGLLLPAERVRPLSFTILCVSCRPVQSKRTRRASLSRSSSRMASSRRASCATTLASACDYCEWPFCLMFA